MTIRMRRPGVAAFVMAACGFGMAGCGSSPTAPAPAATSHVGRYNLVSAKGQSLPAVVYESSGGQKQEVTGGYTELRTGGECAYSTEYRYTEAGGSTRTSSSAGTGTYSVSGGTILFTYGGSQIAGTLSGDTLTIKADVELVYRR